MMWAGDCLEHCTDRHPEMLSEKQLGAALRRVDEERRRIAAGHRCKDQPQWQLQLPPQSKDHDDRVVHDASRVLHAVLQLAPSRGAVDDSMCEGAERAAAAMRLDLPTAWCPRLLACDARHVME